LRIDGLTVDNCRHWAKKTLVPMALAVEPNQGGGGPVAENSSLANKKVKQRFSGY